VNLRKKNNDVTKNEPSNAFINCAQKLPDSWEKQSGMPAHITTQVLPKEWVELNLPGVNKKFNRNVQEAQGAKSNCKLPDDVWDKIEAWAKDKEDKDDWQMLDKALLLRIILEQHLKFNPTGLKKDKNQYLYSTPSDRKSIWNYKPRNEIRGALGTGGEKGIAKGLRNFIKAGETTDFESLYQKLALPNMQLREELTAKFGELKTNIENDPKDCNFQWTVIKGQAYFTVEQRVFQATPEAAEAEFNQKFGTK